MGRLGKVAAGVLGVAGVGAFAAYTKLSSMVKERLQRFASQAAGAPVSVREVSVAPWSGAGRVRGLLIGNPAGYKTDSALRIDEIRIRLEPRSLLGGTIRVHEVVLDSPVLTWEIGAGGGNLGRIRKNIEGPPSALKRKGKAGLSVAMAKAGTAGLPPRQAAPASADGRKVLVERFIVRNGRLRVASSGLGGPVLLPLPDLKLENLGDKPGGASLQEVVSQALDAVVRSGIDAAGGAGSALRSAGAAVSKALGGLLGRPSRSPNDGRHGGDGAPPGRPSRSPNDGRHGGDGAPPGKKR